MVVYWLMLLGGLALYRTTGAAASSLAALGVVAGTATLLGQLLALYDLRPWVAVTVVVAATGYAAPLLPFTVSDTELWRVFLPAALCGFWSLGDRTVIVAAWFPAVIWMLSILDRSDAAATPDGAGLVLLGGLAAVFLWLLRVRESRRVGLWRTIAPVPLALALPPTLRKEAPGQQVARVAWGLSVGAITLAVTAGVAPLLWQIEPLGGRSPESPVRVGSDPAGLPCCPLTAGAETERSRIKEYLDLGRGHAYGAVPIPEDLVCRRCDARVAAGPGGVGAPVVVLATPSVAGPIAAAAIPPAAAPTVTGRWSPAVERLVPQGAAPVDVPRGESAVTAGDDRLPTQLSGTEGPAVPAPASDQVAAIPAGVAEPAPTPVPEPLVPEPAPQASTSDPAAPVATPATTDPGSTPPPAVAHRAVADRARSLLPYLWPWLAVLVVAVVTALLVGLALRPVRRLITLRHLRRPFWSETIAQRVSNAWQLALVGLRDAGWRPTATEAPHELARRVAVDGLDRCATILERARHGIGIDAEDLADMAASAELAYRSARSSLRALERVAGWVRWPLT